ELIEKLGALGTKYGFTINQIMVADVRAIEAAGTPAPMAVVDERGNRRAAHSLAHAAALVRNSGRQTLTDVKRFKGLGEMKADELRETTMSPETRMLKKVQLEDAIEAEELFATLMGTNVRERYEFIQREAPRAKLDV